MARVAQDFVFVKGYWNFGNGGHNVLGYVFSLLGLELTRCESTVETLTTGRTTHATTRFGGRIHFQSSQSDRASSNGRHNGNVITFLQRGGFFVQVANVFVIYIQVDEGAKFAFL